MIRHPKLDAVGTLHHVMGRGISGVKIFGKKKDREDFVERFAVRLRQKNRLFRADVARFLGTNTSGVNRLTVSDELPEIEKYIQIVLEPTLPFFFYKSLTISCRTGHLSLAAKSRGDLEICVFYKCELCKRSWFFPPQLNSALCHRITWKFNSKAGD